MKEEKFKFELQPINFECAKLAYEIGFPQNLFNTSWYNELGDYGGRTDLNKKGQEFREAYPEFKHELFCPLHLKDEFTLKSFIAPSCYLMKDWLSTVHNIEVNITKEVSILDNDYYYIGEVEVFNGIFVNNIYIFDSDDYYELFNNCIFEALTYIEEKQSEKE